MSKSIFFPIFRSIRFFLMVDFRFKSIIKIRMIGTTTELHNLNFEINPYVYGCLGPLMPWKRLLFIVKI